MTPDETEVHNSYMEIEYLRIGSVYGGAWNGERIEKALKLLEVVKKWTESVGK